jgi:hydroxymethylpyrimidine pyrophosphatase-like HAD family hydrolase/hypoxanthine phosphoribosyltransferase
MTEHHIEEERFYSRYGWCLNPILSIEELHTHLSDEVHHSVTLTGWQREESIINIYLFVCAMACTLDDYIGRRLLNTSALRSRLPRFGFLFTAAESVLRVIEWIRGLADYKIRRFRESWDRCVELACNMLIDDSTDLNAQLANFHNALIATRSVTLPKRVLAQRMRLPEAFRRQDFTHQDVLLLARRFAHSASPNDPPTVVVGLRTAGAYFAPLISAYLKRNGWSHVSWFSIRPKKGLSAREQKLLKPRWTRRRRYGRIIVVDDYPATGKTFRLTRKILGECGVRPNQITVIAPTHAAQPNWIELSGIKDPISIVTVQPWELRKAALMLPVAIESLCAEYYRSEGWTGVRAFEDEQTDALNIRLAEHSKDGHHVRDKRVVKIELSADGYDPVFKTILLKSAGWGWLAYHAYIAGTRLEGFVPPLIGLRNGIMITEWIDEASIITESVPSIETARTVGSYVAARTRTLRLSSHNQSKGVTYSAVGVDEIANLLRAGYGPYVSRLKKPVLRKHLYRFMGTAPTMLDGQMKADEWLRLPAAIYKADFEHHNFGGAELDLVDPAYDLAAAMLEFRLPGVLERELLRTYVQESGDSVSAERLLIFKILYGSLVMSHALDRIANGRDPEKNNEIYLYTRNWLIYSMNEYCSTTAGCAKQSSWTDSLFFMDLDGVFEQTLLGFPHATHKGLQSLALLRDTGHSIVLNTGRSVENVRNYCETYGLPGGIAEYGSVFVDAVSKQELRLIDNVGARQLAECKERIKAIPGVFTDPSYEYSIRAYRYRGRATVGLDESEITTLLKDPRFDELICVCRAADTYIVQRKVNKGAAAKFLRQYLGCSATAATAIGDSIHDIPMLTAVEHAYAPANCSAEVRALAIENKCRIMKRRFQSGLLAAVEDRVGRRSIVRTTDAITPRSMMRTFLHAADRPFALHFVAALFWWNL